MNLNIDDVVGMNSLERDSKQKIIELKDINKAHEEQLK